jgi:hypothetical protein
VRKRSLELLSAVCSAHPKRAIVDALMDAKPLARDELEQLVDQLKGASLGEGGTDPPRPRRRTAQRQGDGSPVARIKRLLTVEAGLSAQDSMQELKSELAKAGFSPPPPGRASLDRWLTSLVDAIPAGEVLNAAMTVASRFKQN